MPIYEYRCDSGHTFEVLQRMSDDPLSSCTICEARVQRVFHPVAVHFKGSGFYSTDYGRNNSKGEEAKPKGGSENSDTTSSDKGSGKSEGSNSKPKADSSESKGSKSGSS